MSIAIEGLQVKLTDSKGFFQYERDFSRDKRYSNPQKPGDTPARYSNEQVQQYDNNRLSSPFTLRKTTVTRCYSNHRRFMMRKLGHAYEIYPLFALTGVWFLVFCYTVYYSFEKAEIWLDRSELAAGYGMRGCWLLVP